MSADLQPGADAVHLDIEAWFELQGEAGYIAWRLREILKALKARSPMDVAIDEATGHEPFSAEAHELMARMDEIKKLLGDG